MRNSLHLTHAEDLGEIIKEVGQILSESLDDEDFLTAVQSLQGQVNELVYRSARGVSSCRS